MENRGQITEHDEKYLKIKEKSGTHEFMIILALPMLVIFVFPLMTFFTFLPEPLINFLKLISPNFAMEK